MRDLAEPVIDSLVVDLAPWDGVPGSSAGALTFDAALPIAIFQPFGLMEVDPQGNAKTNSSMNFIVRRDQEVRSPISGVVRMVTFQTGWWEQDYEIALEPAVNSHYQVSIDHVVDPTVQPGDRVSAGQVIARGTNWISGGPDRPVRNPTYGIVELQVNYFADPSCNAFTTTVTRCPMSYVGPAAAPQLRAQISQLMSDWERLEGNAAVYDEAAMPTPGCLTLELTGR